MPPNLPNALTLTRIALVPLFAMALAVPGETARWLALTLYALAALTDAVDGIIARAWAQESHFGRMLDPIADKLLAAAALVMLVADGTLAGWALVPALVILAREILVSGLREYLALLDVSVPVSRIAKWKTVLQLVAIGLLVAAPVLDPVLPGTGLAGLVALWAAAALTLYTGANYLQAALARMETASPPDRDG